MEWKPCAFKFCPQVLAGGGISVSEGSREALESFETSIMLGVILGCEMEGILKIAENCKISPFSAIILLKNTYFLALSRYIFYKRGS